MVTVLAPTPLLTIDVEKGSSGADDLHIHIGGQGVWVARMATALGAKVCLCCALGGETGNVLRHLLEAEPIELKVAYTEAANGGWVEDRRTDDVHCLADMPGEPLPRHAADDLFTLTLAHALDHGVCVLTGVPDERQLAPQFFGRLTSDLITNGCRVVVDLHGAALEQAVGAAPTVVTINDEQMAEIGLAASAEPDDLGRGIRALNDSGIACVVVSRGSEPALAGFDGGLYAVTPPRLEATETRGTGDSMTGALGAALDRQMSMLDAVRLAVAAGAVNVTRRGLGTGGGEPVNLLVDHVTVEELR